MNHVWQFNHSTCIQLSHGYQTIVRIQGEFHNEGSSLERWDTAIGHWMSSSQHFKERICLHLQGAWSKVDAKIGYVVRIYRQDMTSCCWLRTSASQAQAFSWGAVKGHKVNCSAELITDLWPTSVLAGAGQAEWRKEANPKSWQWQTTHLTVITTSNSRTPNSPLHGTANLGGT